MENRNYDVNNGFVPRRVRQAIYKLKRLYGATIRLYKQGDKTVDLRTGQITWTGRSVCTVNRAIVLPVKLNRTQTQTISMISSDKQFVYGGTYDIGTRNFFIDPRDLVAGYEVAMDDWIVYRGKKYEIKTVMNNEFDSLWEVTAVEMMGVVPDQIHELTGYSIVDFQQTSSGE